MRYQEALAKLQEAQAAKADVESEVRTLRLLGWKVKHLRERRSAAWRAVSEARRVLEESEW